MGAPL